MAEEGDVLTNLDPNAGANGADNQPVAGLISQYIKDLSVENPNAPESFQWTETPEVDVQFNIGARQVNDEVHEIELKIAATAKTGNGVIYVVELAYCSLIGLRNIPEEQAHAFLYAEGAAHPVPLRPPRHRRCDTRCRLCAAAAGSDRFPGPLRAAIAAQAGRAGGQGEVPPAGNA